MWQSSWLSVTEGCNHSLCWQPQILLWQQTAAHSDAEEDTIKVSKAPPRLIFVSWEEAVPFFITNYMRESRSNLMLIKLSFTLINIIWTRLWFGLPTLSNFEDSADYNLFSWNVKRWGTLTSGRSCCDRGLHFRYFSRYASNSKASWK